MSTDGNTYSLSAAFPHQVFDAEYPPSSPPSSSVGVMGYLGGPRASRAWTLEDWLPFAELRQFPIYVPDLGGNPLSQAREAVQLATALGWAAHLPGAQTRAIIIDLETSSDPAWYDRHATMILAHGFVPVVYGSLGDVLGNAAADVLAADWDDKAVIPLGQTLHGKQYAASIPFQATSIDYSVIDGWLLERGGVGPRHRVAA